MKNKYRVLRRLIPPLFVCVLAPGIADAACSSWNDSTRNQLVLRLDDHGMRLNQRKRKCVDFLEGAESGSFEIRVTSWWGYDVPTSTDAIRAVIKPRYKDKYEVESVYTPPDGSFWSQGKLAVTVKWVGNGIPPDNDTPEYYIVVDDVGQLDPKVRVIKSPGVAALLADLLNTQLNELDLDIDTTDVNFDQVKAEFNRLRQGAGAD